MRFDSERDVAGARPLKVGHGVKQQSASKPAAALAGGYRERADVAAAAGEQAAGDPADRLAVAPSEKQRARGTLLLSPGIEVTFGVPRHWRPRGVDIDQPVHRFVGVTKTVRRDGDPGGKVWSRHRRSAL